MQTLQNAIAAIKYFQPRKDTNAKTKAEVVGMKKKFDHKKCIECGDHVPAYQNFYCEKCWRDALNAKLEADEHAAAVKKSDQRGKK